MLSISPKVKAKGGSTGTRAPSVIDIQSAIRMFQTVKPQTALALEIALPKPSNTIMKWANSCVNDSLTREMLDLSSQSED